WIFDSIEPGNYLFEITAEYVAGESLPASLAITVTSNEDILQPVFGLCNYPNPFNPSTTISYSVPTDGDVALSIYNARGQLVNTLVNEYKSKGRYLIAWQAKDLRGASVASGVYFLRLRSGNQSISRKILLTK
ncbi:MAG TPA: T9SS type A sorting domain-containing protein, partial [Candidatus Cloacimonadota bacterium]|nr:T9SS type A sorting domain-containing protein [Candidatus Cloacimonadota bacterium]